MERIDGQTHQTKRFDETRIKRKVLISVANKDGIVEFARALKDLQFDIIATGGTRQLLQGNGIEAIKISDYTGGSESDRVKTLSRRIAKEILETGEIGLVVCNLYPFFAQKGKSLDEMIEFVDIGGVTLIRAAAKNYRQVGVVYDPRKYNEIIEQIKNNTFTPEFRLNLARRAFDYIAWYDTVIAEYFSSNSMERGYFSAAAEKFLSLRHGENPHQKAIFFLDRLRQGDFMIHGGKQISYNNITDAEVAIGTACEFINEIACTVIKHQTPCCVALGDTQAEAFERAYMADSISAFGGIVGLNRTVEEKTAETIRSHFFEVIIAPGYEKRALEILKTNQNVRILEVSPRLMSPLVYKPVFGGILVQERDQADFENWEVVTKRTPNDYETETLKFAWKVVKWTKSNSVVLAVKGRTVGIGAGQTSRIGAVEIALRQSVSRSAGVVIASDAFFPFRDSIDAVAKGGVTAVIQPGGSQRDQEVIEACNEHGMAMVFTHVRHFKH